MTRAVLASVLLLAFVAQAASVVQSRSCPMLERTALEEQPGCEHCPPPPPELALRPALPHCCAWHAVTVETSVSEPVRASQASSAAALAPPHVVLVPVMAPLLRPAAPGARAPAPPPPLRNLPLLS
ncbi:MAG TPA: hypothetical protein VMH40_00945 [Myxococcaceae bacterium]|nr:hypothetical protein [Myxococcaceae bacterium]